MCGELTLHVFATQGQFDIGKSRRCRRRHRTLKTRRIDAKAENSACCKMSSSGPANSDIIHNQADFVPLGFSRLVNTPVVTTIHGFSSARIVPVFKEYEDRVHYVAISDANRHPDLRYAATIHHGIPIDDFPFDPLGSDDLHSSGRIHPDKGCGSDSNCRSGWPPPHHGRYRSGCGLSSTSCGASTGRSATYLGSVGGLERTRVLGSARALLHLINFDEPFGVISC